MQHGACHPKYAEHLKEGLLNQSCILHKLTSGENKNQRLARKNRKIVIPRKQIHVVCLISIPFSTIAWDIQIVALAVTNKEI
jgi:hypothetical protein